MNRTQPPEDGTAQGDRLMSHLAAASELLAGRHFRRAEVEILRALSTTPSDVRALNLLALVRFKLGKLEEAQGTYREIAALQPSDANIQRNFGLVSLKMDRYDDAVAALERATRLAPDDLRAWSYLGYALAKSGDNTGAALAFRRGGQDLLAAQLEPAVAPVARVSTSEASASDVITSKVSNHAGKAAKAETAAPAPAPDVSVIGGQRTDVRSDELPAALALVARPEVPAPRQGVSLVSFVLAGLGLGSLSLPARAAAFSVEDEATVRASAALAWAGAPSWPTAFRRVRGRATDVPLGTKRDAFFRVSGGGQLWVAGPSGRWATVTLDDDIFYLREDAVLAFDSGVSWEAGRIPGDGLRLLQFRGSGRVALRFEQTPTAVRVISERPVFVPRARLYGWVGRIVSHGLRDADRLFQVHCEGEGVLLLDEGRSSRHHRRGRPAADADRKLA